mmetsp:Transcript_83730/g.166155  ORF Transcript_83730/g.166155 Transcript_83730/m.166155 type:complete len:232 (-) Transcript_83730:589-1284(-)
MALSVLFNMIVSSEVATWNVSFMKTATMTDVTEKPMTNLCARKKIMYHSLTFSTSALHGGIQLPSVSSNMVRNVLANEPKYLNTSAAPGPPLRMWSSTSDCKIIAMHIWTNARTNTVHTTTVKLPLIAVVIRYKESKTLTVLISRSKRISRISRASLSNVGLIPKLTSDTIESIQEPTMTESIAFHQSLKKSLHCASTFKKSSVVKRLPSTISTIRKNRSAQGHTSCFSSV